MAEISDRRALARTKMAGIKDRKYNISYKKVQSAEAGAELSTR